MLITINDIIQRGWWNYGKIRKYLTQINETKKNNYYNEVDVELIEKLEKAEILRHIPKNPLQQDNSFEQNIINMIHINIEENLNIRLIKKKSVKYLKSIKNKYNNKISAPTQNNKQRNLLISYMRHNYTDYDSIREKIDNFNFDFEISNKLIKLLKIKTNNLLIIKYHELRRGEK